jgi:hypothetical protein
MRGKDTIAMIMTRHVASLPTLVLALLVALCGAALAREKCEGFFDQKTTDNTREYVNQGATCICPAGSRKVAGDGTGRNMREDGVDMFSCVGRPAAASSSTNETTKGPCGSIISKGLENLGSGDKAECIYFANKCGGTITFFARSSVVGRLATTIDTLKQGKICATKSPPKETMTYDGFRRL